MPGTSSEPRPPIVLRIGMECRQEYAPGLKT